jgi:hypothetical protein
MSQRWAPLLILCLQATAPDNKPCCVDIWSAAAHYGQNLYHEINTLAFMNAWNVKLYWTLLKLYSSLPAVGIYTQISMLESDAGDLWIARFQIIKQKCPVAQAARNLHSR